MRSLLSRFLREPVLSAAAQAPGDTQRDFRVGDLVLYVGASQTLWGIVLSTRAQWLMVFWHDGVATNIPRKNVVWQA